MERSNANLEAMEARMDRLQESLDAYRLQADKAGKVLLAEEGLELKPIAMTSEDAQYIATRQFQRSDIAMFWLADRLPTPVAALNCWASMMARSRGPPGTSRVMANTIMVTPSNVGGMSSNLLMK